MIRRMLNQGFVIYVSNVDDKLKGCCLKVLENGNGMLPVELKDSDVEVINSFSNIYGMLNDGNVLQIYSKGNKINSSIGVTGYEGPYAEIKCFNEVAEADDTELYSSLMELDNKVGLIVQEQKTREPKRRYRFYGEDKFK